MCPPDPPVSPQVIDYKSTRDLETFSKFLDSGGQLPAEEPTEEPVAPFPVGASVPRFLACRQVLWMHGCGADGGRGGRGCSFQLGLGDFPGDASQFHHRAQGGAVAAQVTAGEPSAPAPKEAVGHE